MREPEIRVLRLPSFMSVAMEVAPLVRRGIITDAEGRWLVNRRWNEACRKAKENE